MANSPQAIKRARQAETRRQHNTAIKSRMRTAIKSTRRAIATGDVDSARSAYAIAQSVIDKTAQKKVVHANTAARYKSRLVSAIKALQASAAH